MRYHKECKLLASVALVAVFSFYAAAQPRAVAAKPNALKCTPPETTGKERMTYKVGASNTLNREETARIEETWGALVVPKGETERAKQIREAAEAYWRGRTDAFNSAYDHWLEISPNATAKQKREWRAVIDRAIKVTVDPPGNRQKLALKSFDYRHLIEPWAVIDQGKACNTCWAIATSAAAAANMVKNYWDGLGRISIKPDRERPGAISAINGAVMITTKAGPFVQELLNCMPIKKTEICEDGWHGTAFNFMVYEKGIPMADLYKEKESRQRELLLRQRSYQPHEKYACNPSGSFLKGDAWDYVNSPPDQLPTVQQLKQALVEHGPIVAPIYYDECLAAYRGGVFNEKNNGMVNHVVLLIGWDDKKKAWLVKNSWGEAWGEKGSGWIKYGSNNIGVFAAWIEVPANPLVPPSLLPSNGKLQ